MTLAQAPQSTTYSGVPLHLTKVAVGCRTLESLEKRISTRSVGGEVRVVTRMRPKRMAEIVEGGTISVGDPVEAVEPNGEAWS